MSNINDSIFISRMSIRVRVRVCVSDREMFQCVLQLCAVFMDYTVRVRVLFLSHFDTQHQRSYC